MMVLPARFYRDPAELVGEVRKLREAAKRKAERKAERDRIHKSRRIKALVREVMMNGGAR